MKKIFLGLILGGFCLSVLAADDVLVERALRDLQSVRDTMQTLHRDLRSKGAPEARTLGESVERIRAIEKDLSDSLRRRQRPPRRQPIVGHYCSATCVDSAGRPDLRYSAGARGEFELEALQLAKNETQRKYRCSFGVTSTGCNPEFAYAEKRYCYSACTNSAGRIDLRYAGLGEGLSLIEATQLSQNAANTKHRCSFGIKNATCSQDSIPTYCSAACLKSSGSADSRYSVGMRGENQAHAEYLAIQETQNKHRCSFGIAILQCSSN